MTSSLKVLLALCLASVALSAQADIVTLDGTDITLSYDPSNYSMAPSLTPSGLSYGSNVISAQAGGSNGAGPNQVTSSISFVISLTDPNQSFNSISLNAHGSYLLNGTGSSVSLAGSTMTVAAVSSGPTTSAAITPLAPLTDPNGQTNDWTAGATTSLSAGQWGAVRSVRVTIFDELTASASAGSSASISAGFLGLGPQPDSITLGLTTVPLPASLPLLCAGLLGLIALSRRCAPRVMYGAIP